MILSSIQEVRKLGIKKSWRKYGWKLVLAVFLYYLVRDLFLYVFVPFAVVQLMN